MRRLKDIHTSDASDASVAGEDDAHARLFLCLVLVLVLRLRQVAFTLVLLLLSLCLRLRLRRWSLAVNTSLKVPKFSDGDGNVDENRTRLYSV